MERTPKELHESEVFCGFVTAANLPIDPRSVQNDRPPAPDIRCVTRDDVLVHFELAEILWEDPQSDIKTLAHGLDRSQRASEQKAALLAAGCIEEAAQLQTWGAFGHPPLASLLHVLQKKCAKTYQTDGRPVSLLLYYERETPLEPFDLLAEHPLRDAIGMLLTAGAFSDIWIYHHATAYTFSLAGIRPGTRISAPLSNLTRPEDQRWVIGHITMAQNGPGVIIDASASHAFHNSATALALARERHKAAATKKPGGDARGDDL